MNLDDLFIPPPNALQFHIQWSHLGDQNQTCWVIPVKLEKPVDQEARLPGCTCSVWFQIIRHDNPVMEAARLKLDEGQFLYVCECFGQVVE